MNCILDVKNLEVAFRQGKTMLPLVKGVSFSVKKGMCLGILGESGSGKSMTMKGIIGLLDKQFLVKGAAVFEKTDLLQMSNEELRKLRGREITMILQNPMSCFDPLYRIGDQMAETFYEHQAFSGEEMRQLKIDTLKRMQIKNPEDVLQKYPHQLSGGMLQRVMIGLAIALKPQLLIADEPTTAIDSITQYEILEDLMRIKKEDQTSMVFISHDLGVISKIADEIIVMHNGKAAARGTLDQIIENSRDEYTRTLFHSRIKVMRQFEKMTGVGNRDGGALNDFRSI